MRLLRTSSGDQQPQRFAEYLLLLVVQLCLMASASEARTWEDIISVSIYAQSNIDLPRIKFSLEEDPLVNTAPRSKAPTLPPTPVPTQRSPDYPSYNIPGDFSCPQGASVFIVNKYDSWGDGWEGTTMTIQEMGESEESVTISKDVELGQESSSPGNTNETDTTKTSAPETTKPPTPFPTPIPSPLPSPAPTIPVNDTDADREEYQTEFPEWWYDTEWPTTWWPTVSPWPSAWWLETEAPWYEVGATDDDWAVASPRSFFGGRRLEFVMQGSLESGSFGTEHVCLFPDTCYQVTMEGGQWQEESKWEILQVQENGGQQPVEIAKGKGLHQCTFSLGEETTTSCPFTCHPDLATELQQNKEAPVRSSFYGGSSSITSPPTMPPTNAPAMINTPAPSRIPTIV